ncbi:biotin--[acetyl-CoA-carboxylase] ligase [Nanoarchaeota archaeon]
MRQVIFLKSVVSTQDYVKRNLSLSDKIVVVAERQTKGRGRGRRKWHSNKGGLWFSILLKDVQESEAKFLGMCAVLAVAKLLKKKGIGARVKWPNDVYADKKKICGVLIETVSEGEWMDAIVGVGLNVKNDPPLRTATSMVEVTGKSFDLRLLLKQVVREFFKMRALYEKDASVLYEVYEEFR